MPPLVAPLPVFTLCTQDPFHCDAVVAAITCIMRTRTHMHAHTHAPTHATGIGEGSSNGWMAVDCGRRQPGASGERAPSHTRSSTHHHRCARSEVGSAWATHARACMHARAHACMCAWRRRPLAWHARHRHACWSPPGSARSVPDARPPPSAIFVTKVVLHYRTAVAGAARVTGDPCTDGTRGAEARWPSSHTGLIIVKLGIAKQGRCRPCIRMHPPVRVWPAM